MKIVSCLIAALLGLPLFALPGPSSAPFDKGALFTVAGYTGSSQLSGFPVLVRIAENSPSGFSYDELHSKSTGADIAFVGMDGVGLPFEIDTWNTNGTSLIWVRLPSLRNGTQFVMCWGSETSGKTVCGTNPWIDYTGVWHMGETGTPSDSNPVTIHDSTTNELHGSTAVGSFVSEGPFGGARRIATDRNNAHGIVVDATSGARKDAADAMGADFHASCWVHAQGPDSTYGFFFDRRKGENGSGWGVRLSTDNKMQVYYGQGREARKETQANYSALYDTSVGNWNKIDVLYKYQANDGQKQTVDIYLNGTYKESVDLSKEPVPLENASIGIGGSTQDNPSDNNKGRHFNGEMDEVRLGAFVPSADWIAADYATQSSPSFLAAGPAESYTGAPIVGLSVSDVGYTNATFTVDVLSLGAGAASATVTAQIAASTDFTAPLWTSSFTASGVDSRVMTAKGLPPGAVYWVRVVMSNGSVVMAETSPTSFATLAPIAVTGIGWTFSADGSTADFSFGISAVSNIAIGSAKLEYDGRTVSSQTFSSAGTLVWTGVPAAGRTAPATVTVSADVGGTTYTHTWAVTVSPGSHAYAVSSLAEVSSLALHVGDTLTLPALARADDRYVAAPDVLVQIDRVGEPEDVILAADDVGRTGDLRKILRREIGQLQHHVVELVGLEQVPDRHAEGEIGLELVGVGVGAAGDDCAGQLRVVRGDLDGVDAAVAVAHDQRLLQAHRPDELRVVLRHQGVGDLARVAALAVAAAFGQIHRIIIRKVLRSLFE